MEARLNCSEAYLIESRTQHIYRCINPQLIAGGEIEMSSDAPGIPGATVMPQWWMVPTLLLSAAATMLVTTM